MKNLMKMIMVSIIGIMLSTTSSMATESKEFKVLPIFTEDNWDPEIEVELVNGVMDFNKDGVDKSKAIGLGFSFACPVFTLPGNHILRQQLNVNMYDKEGMSIANLEMNPHYFFKIEDNFLLGFGPGVGVMKVNPDNSEEQLLLTAQAGVSMKYYIGNVMAGFDIRHQWTAEKNLGNGIDENMDNTRYLVKVGYSF